MGEAGLNPLALGGGERCGALDSRLVPVAIEPDETLEARENGQGTTSPGSRQTFGDEPYAAAVEAALDQAQTVQPPCRTLRPFRRRHSSLTPSPGGGPSPRPAVDGRLP